MVAVLPEGEMAILVRRSCLSTEMNWSILATADDGQVGRSSRMEP